MEKLVVFPLNNDTEILIKGLKENKLYQVVAVSSYIEDRSRLELLQKKSSIYCSTEFEECLTRADAIVFQKIQWDIVMTDTKKSANGIRLREKDLCWFSTAR